MRRQLNILKTLTQSPLGRMALGIFYYAKWFQFRFQRAFRILDVSDDFIPEEFVESVRRHGTTKMVSNLDAQRKIQILRHSGASQVAHFCTNRFSTTKYSWYSFIPMFLYEQFSMPSNLFFLLISILQIIPGVSTIGQYTTLLPLLLLLSISALREIAEDLYKRSADKAINRILFETYCDSGWNFIECDRLKVGSVVRIRSGQYLPADILLLSTSDRYGTCKIMTANLDGETNIKERRCHSSTMQITYRNGFQGLSSIEYEKPNRNLYEFHGRLFFDGMYQENTQYTDNVGYTVNEDNVILRGTQLLTTHYIDGLILYTGPETKLSINTPNPPLKLSSLQEITNKQIVYVFISLIMLCLVSVGGKVLTNSITGSPWYLPYPNEYHNFGDMIRSFFTFLVLYNDFVPISLMMSIEFVKMIQTWIINNDYEMRDGDNELAEAKSLKLVDELGMIHYVFTDKTGTLTCNEMAFRSFCVVTDDDIIRKYEPSFKDDEDYSPTNHSVYDRVWYDLEMYINADNERQSFKHLAAPSIQLSENLRHLMTMLALCNTVTVQFIPFEGMTGKYVPGQYNDHLHYMSESPDEKALVEGARQFDFTFVQRTQDSEGTYVHLSLKDNMIMYRLVKTIKFTSDRKRMSVILECPDGEWRLYCKGADNVMKKLLKRKENTYRIRDVLNGYARQGYRTLVYGWKYVSHEEVNKFEHDINAVTTSKTSRKAKLEKISDIEFEMESGLRLVGISAVEDKLQENVGETIKKLRIANIGIWMLTGDKMETAENVAMNCRLFKKSMFRTDKIFHIDCDTDTENYKKRTLDQAQSVLKYLVQENRLGKINSDIGLVLQGDAVETLLEEMEADFCSMATSFQSVVACRLSPSLKADLVKLVQIHKRKNVLAIGDGANDVAMIQAARVGVGIKGNEGMQAKLASDFAIGKFCFLNRLLFIHGVWSYFRICKLIQFSFYKNVLIYFINFLYQWFNGFSGQACFEQWTLSMYNLAFTSFQPCCVAVFDRPWKDKSMLAHSQLYDLSQSNRIFTNKLFWGNIINAIFHGCIIFIMSYEINYLGSILPYDIQVGGIYSFGYMIYLTTLITVTIKLFLVMDIMNSVTLWFIFLSVFAYLLWMVVTNYWASFPITSFQYLVYDNTGLASEMSTSLVFWISSLLLIPVVATYRDLIWKCLLDTFYDSFGQVVRLLEDEEDAKARIETKLELLLSTKEKRNLWSLIPKSFLPPRNPAPRNMDATDLLMSLDNTIMTISRSKSAVHDLDP